MLVYLLRAGDAATGVWRVATRGGGADARGEIRAGLVSPTRVLSSRWHPSRRDPEPLPARTAEPRYSQQPCVHRSDRAALMPLQLQPEQEEEESGVRGESRLS